MKKLLKYVLLILIGVIAFLLTSFIVLTQVAPKLEHPECYSSGGKWATFPTGCVDRCGAQVCTQAFTEGCDCGEGSCWNGTGCIRDATYECLITGGQWREFPNGCVDLCGAEDCLQAFTYGCDCGADKCWNGTHCYYERVEMKEEISLPSTEVPNAANNAEVEELYFETISKGSSSEHEERAAYLITNGSDWESLIRSTKIAIPDFPKINFGEEMVIPKIDFKEEMVIAVFQGTFGSGHGIEITRIVVKGDFLEVFVKESYEAAVTPVQTRPYHVIKTEKIDKKLIFPEGNLEIVNSGYSAPIRILGVGETKTFMIDTRDYEVTIAEVSGMPLKAEFTFNGEVFVLGKGEAYETHGGIKVKVHNVTEEFVEFELLP